MKNMQKQMSINSVDDVMDEIQEQTENMKQIQEALSAPIGTISLKYLACDKDEVNCLFVIFEYITNDSKHYDYYF